MVRDFLTNIMTYHAMFQFNFNWSIIVSGALLPSKLRASVKIYEQGPRLFKRHNHEKNYILTQKLSVLLRIADQEFLRASTE